MEYILHDPTVADIHNALCAVPAPSGLVARPVSKFVIDSREAEPGCCFIALRGEQQDGHSYILGALESGATTIIADATGIAHVDRSTLKAHIVPVDDRECQRDSCLTDGQSIVYVTEDALTALQNVSAYWRDRFDPRVIGITGSVGKSTSKEMIAAVLTQRFATLRNPGNLNNEIGLPLTLLQLRGTHQRAVLEMGMYDLGEIARLAALSKPQVGVVTNVGPTHLERLGSIERIAQAKAELVQALPAEGVAVLNGDDDIVRAMADLTDAEVFLYGLTPDCALWASDIVSEGMEGIRFRFHYGGESVYAKLPLLGRHSVHTALRAAAIGLIEGLDWGEIVSGLRDVSGHLRLMVVQGIKETTLIDDTYNASPSSSLAALNLLNDLEGRKIAVLGDMLELGDYEESGHRLVGCRAANVAQILVSVGHRARWIAAEAEACGMPAEAIHTAINTEEALTMVSKMVAPGDLILVKGSRGMAMERIVAALTRPAPDLLGEKAP
jgi:UDP-N-acetylmuramoyl-tripeptide--D-alanyl-D-alanine ligase